MNIVLPVDYMGFWRLDRKRNRADISEAIFFMSIESRGEKISGVIEDELGSAVFEGERMEDMILFRKKFITYIPPHCTIQPNKVITHEARREGEVYSGKFNFNKARGIFILEPFPQDCQTLQRIYENICRRNESRRRLDWNPVSGSYS